MVPPINIKNDCHPPLNLPPSAIVLIAPHFFGRGNCELHNVLTSKKKRLSVQIIHRKFGGHVPLVSPLIKKENCQLHLLHLYTCGPDKYSMFINYQWLIWIILSGRIQLDTSGLSGLKLMASSLHLLSNYFRSNKSQLSQITFFLSVYV